MKLNLPKEYLSYSQMNLWLKDKEAYRQRYYLDGPSFENKETIFGKKVAKMLEDGIADPVLDRVPRYQFMEHKIKNKVLGVPFLAVLDTFSLRRKGIKEYKTGKEPWDDLRVRKHDQLVIYSLLSKIAYKKVDRDVELVWIETRYAKEMQRLGSRMIEGESGTLEFTGKIMIFKRRIFEWERKRMAKIIRKTALEISEDHTKFLNEKSI